MILKHSLSSLLVLLLCLAGYSQKDTNQSTKILGLKEAVITDYLALDDLNTLIITTDNLSSKSLLQCRSEKKMTSINVDYPGPLKLKKSKFDEFYLITLDSAFRIDFASDEMSLIEAISIYDFYTELNRISEGRNIISEIQKNGNTQVLVYQSEKKSYDTTYLNQDYRCAHVKLNSIGQTANLTGKPDRSAVSNYNYSSNYGGAVILEVDSSGRPTMIDREPIYSSRMESTRQSQYEKSRRSSSSLQQPIFFYAGGEIIAIDGDRKIIARHSGNGELLSTNKIDYARPVVWSNGSDEFAKHEGEIFISTNNSKGFQYSRLNHETGVAELVFKSDKYWHISRIKHSGNMLYYVQSHNGIEELHQIKIK